MAIFTPDFEKVEASIPVYDKGRYRVLITAKKPVMKEVTNKETNVVTTQAFVQYNLELKGRFDDTGELETEGYDGRTVTPYKVWLHTEGGWQFGKPFLMAACGYRVKDEQNANENLFQKNEWGFSGEVDGAPESFELGNGWDLPVDKLVDCNMFKKVQDKDGVTYENQEFGGWTPVE